MTRQKLSTSMMHDVIAAAS